MTEEQEDTRIDKLTMLATETLLRISCLENILIKKGVLSQEELSQEMDFALKKLQDETKRMYEAN